MTFFRDRTVNLLNLHYGIHSIALSGGGAFFAVYLLKAGVSLPWVLASLSLILAGRLLIRPVVVPIAVHSGLRALVIAGTCLTALQYPLLAAVHGVGLGLFALCLLTSLGTHSTGRAITPISPHSATMSIAAQRWEHARRLRRSSAS